MPKVMANGQQSPKDSMPNGPLGFGPLLAIGNWTFSSSKFCVFARFRELHRCDESCQPSAISHQPSAIGHQPMLFYLAES